MRLAAAIDDARRLLPCTVTRNGDLAADLRDGPPETVDRPRALVRRCGMVPFAHARELLKPVDVVGINYYPARGGMGWHTNSNAPGWRIYLPLALDAHGGSGLITTDGRFPDQPGFANAFRIGPWRESWHAVWADGARLSIGARITDATARELGLERAAV